jgi:hypothetical protein
LDFFCAVLGTQAMAFLETHWVKTAKGDWVSKKDLKDDEMNFEDLLNSFKEEDGLSLDDH